MQYTYAVNSIGEISTQSYLDSTALRETTTTQSDWSKRTISKTFMDNTTTTMEYNSKGQMVKSTDPDGIITLYAYNTKGERTTTATDLNQNGVIDYGTDTIRFSETTPALDGTIPAWRTVKKIWQDSDSNNANGIETTLSTTYIKPNNLSARRESLGEANSATATIMLNGNGDWTETTDNPNGIKQIKSYQSGLLSTTISVDTLNIPIESISQGYDNLKRPTTQTHSRTGTTTTEYLSNTADVIKSVTDPGNRKMQYAYDIRGRRNATTLPDNTVTFTTHTPRNEVERESGSLTYPTSHTYDYAGRLKTLTTTGASGNAITAWNYSPLTGQIISKKYDSNLSGTTGSGPAYAYTPADRLLSRTWASGKHTRYDYDSGGRVTHIRYFTTASADNGNNPGNDPDTPDVTISYDSLNRPIELSNAKASTLYEYSSSNLTLVKETITYDWNLDQTPDLVRVIDRSRDNLLRPSGFELKNGNTIESATTYQFSTIHGRLASVSGGSDLSGNSQFNYSYTPESNLIETIQTPVHTVTNRWENTRNVLASKQNKIGNTVISSYGYVVNQLGQRRSVDTEGIAFTAGQRDRAWSYDFFGQIITETDADNDAFNRGFAYDSIGNRIASIEGDTDPTANGATTYTTSKLNQYTTVGPFNPTHDADGNTIETQIRTGGIGSTALYQATFIWDGENRLIEVKNSNGNTLAKYDYDAQSQRIRRSVTAGETIAYIYNGWNPIAEYSITNNQYSISKSYTWGLDLSGSIQGAGGVGGLLMVSIITNNSIANNFYPTYDGNGNVSEYLDSNGNIAAHYEYDAFGNVLNYTENTTGLAELFSHRFSSKQQDKETGLLYYGYRYLDTVSGRWPSRDPIGERGGINLYGFVWNNGVNLWDLLGLQNITQADLDDLDRQIEDHERELERQEHEHALAEIERKRCICEAEIAETAELIRQLGEQAQNEQLQAPDPAAEDYERKMLMYANLMGDVLSVWGISGVHNITRALNKRFPSIVRPSHPVPKPAQPVNNCNSVSGNEPSIASRLMDLGGGKPRYVPTPKGAPQWIFPNGNVLRFDLKPGQFLNRQGPHINLEIPTHTPPNIHIPLSK